MIDGGDFYKISERMCLAMRRPDQAFDGINIIAAGDFAQLPPINRNGALYVSAVGSEKHTTHSVERQKVNIGKTL